jgi:hypothetical protein
VTKWTGKKLSDIPWKELTIGMKVLGATGIQGEITKLLTPPADRFESIWIDWEDGQNSWVFHDQADHVTCL